jgi:hypothetical protein
VISTKPTRNRGGRPLRLLHLMVLVGAVAVSCYVVPALVGASHAGLGSNIFSPYSRWDRFIELASTTLILWAFLLSGFTLVLSCRSLRRAGRSYGTAAVFAAAISVVALAFHRVIVDGANTALGVGARALHPINETLAGDFLTILNDAPGTMAAAILAVWSILAMIRAGRRPAGGLGVLNVCFATVCLLWGLLGDLMYLVP